MKKQLLQLCLFFLVPALSFAQQGKSGSFSNRSSHSLSNATHAYSKAIQPIPTTTTGTCMSVNLPTPTGWTLTNYGSGTGTFAQNGFVNGPNSDGDKEKAMYFDLSASSNTLITQVYIGFDIAYTATPTKTVAIKIYEGSSGTVGASLGTATISMAEIMSDVAANRYSLAIFSSPIVTTSKRFFASVDVSGLEWSAGVKDSLSIVSNTDPQTNPTQVWEKWTNNTWHRYTTSGSWNLNISLLIHPFLTQAPLVATFSTSSNTICAGGSVNYNAAGSTAGSYQWGFGAVVTPTASGITAAATYSAAGTYTTIMIVSDACGSFAGVRSYITVNAKPSVSATPASTAVCVGTNISLAGGGATSYTWTGGVTDGASFAPISTNYTVTGTAANGCTNTAVASVTVNSLPNVTSTPASTAVCVGTNISLSGGGAATYTWTGGVTDGASFAPTSTNYTVTGTSANGCTNTAVASVTVNTLPSVTASPASTAVCAGTNISLNGGGANTYTWTGGVTNGVAFAPASGNYTVTATDANGCVNTAVASVTVNSLPNVTATPSSTTVCAGTNITLTAGGSASTYTWSNGVIDNTAFAPVSADYTVTGTDANGCENTAVSSVTVNSIPTVSANTTATTVCAGANVTLTGSGATTYTWSSGVVDGAPFAPTATETYTVTGETDGCFATATVEVEVSTCTGIKNVSAATFSTIVYPNPSNGDFMIASDRNDVIVITNELGQNIQTIQLNQSNNFSSKVSNLSAGIYFVTGTTIKQKIVVTK